VPYIIEKNGRPAVAIIDVAEFEKLQKKVIWPTRLYTDNEIQEFLKEDQIQKVK
jgi:PHD/YefM family antitoxin component YafN of YafNO toxin-antitoxin module